MLVVGIGTVVATLWILLDHNGSWDARSFPLISAATLILLGGLLLRPSADEEAPATSIPRGPFYLLALVIIYLWLIGKFGYLISTAAIAPVTLWLFGIRNPTTLAVAAIAIPAAYHVLFFEVLGVFPPYGEWFDLFDVIGG